MTDQELQYLRDLHAGMAMIGLLVKGDKPLLQIPSLAYEIADGMQQARKLHDGGIASIKRRFAKKDVSSENQD